MAEAGRILLVDDDADLREELRRVLSRAGYSVLTTADGLAALVSVRSGDVDLVITEIRLSEIHGLEFLSVAKNIKPSIDIIFLTRFGTIEDAVHAIKAGASDFLTKPVRSDRLLTLIRQVLGRHAVRPGEGMDEFAFQDVIDERQLVGRSRAFCQMMDLVAQVAVGSAAVLIQGESGSGKELVAQAIHKRSQRCSGPFIAVKCGVQPGMFLEAELFGYELGSSHGATSSTKKGAIELANAGTLFLDELADMPQATQARLLGVVAGGGFIRLGGVKARPLNVRVIAGTAQDPAQLVHERLLRKDLYYRLGVVTIRVPPLRQRREDVPMLAQHFLRAYAARNNRRLGGFTEEAMRQLENYTWPGNVRELENVIERGVVLARESLVGIGDLPEQIAGAKQRFVVSEAIAALVGTPLAEVKRCLLEETLRVTKGNKTLTARFLGVDLRTVARKF